MVDAGQWRRIGAPEEQPEEHELRSVAQLKMLHSLAPRLNRLNDVQIGDAITAELKTLIDYHSCRVYLLAEDGVALIPIVFRGDLTEYQSDTYEELHHRGRRGIHRSRGGDRRDVLRRRRAAG